MIDRSLDRRMADYFAVEASSHAPDGTMDAILSRVALVDQRRSPAERATRWWGPTSRTRRLILVLTALAAIAGTLVVGSFLQRPEPDAVPPSLILIETPPGAVGDPSVPVSVVTVAADGRVAPLATLTSAALGGTYSEWWAETSADGHLAVSVTVDGESAPAVVDLRVPGEPAAHPDASGSFPAFSPDGRLAFQTNSGSYAIFDPSTRSTTFTVGSSFASPLQFPFAPIWAASGDGLIGQSPQLGVYRLDGTFDPGMAPVHYGGVGPRRFDAAGSFLDCPNCGGDPVELTATTPSGATERRWHDDRPDLDVADYAWASDGGIWLLLESVKPGPRAVTLFKLSGGDRLERFAEFVGAADDPDPGSYSSAASIAAMTPGDGRMVLRVAPVGGGHDELWLFDTTARSRTRLPDGIVAGWLGPDTLSAARPSRTALTETDPAVRGAWSNGPNLVRIQRTSLTVGLGDPTDSFAIDARTPGEIVVDGTAGWLDCQTGAGGTYRWSVASDALRLTPVHEPCARRQSLLAGSYRRVLPFPDTGSPPVTAGATYLVPDADAPFTVTPPTGLDTFAFRHGDGIASLGLGPEPKATITLLTPTDGRTDICDRHSTRRPLGPGADSTAEYLLSLGPTATISEIDPRPVGGQPTRSFELVAMTCPDYAILVSNSAGAAVYASGKTRLHVVTVDRDHVVVVVATVLGGGGSETDRWISETLASIRFETTP